MSTAPSFDLGQELLVVAMCRALGLCSDHGLGDARTRANAYCVNLSSENLDCVDTLPLDAALRLDAEAARRQKLYRAEIKEPRNEGSGA